MQVPPLSSATTTRRSLNLKNAALWDPNHVKTAPEDASAAPEYLKHNEAPYKPEKHRPLSFPTKVSESGNGTPRCEVQSFIQSSGCFATTTGRPLNMKIGMPPSELPTR